MSHQTTQAVHPSAKTGTWIRTVEVGMGRKGQGFCEKAGQALRAEWWLASQLTALSVPANAPAVLRVPGRGRGSPFPTRVSSRCVAGRGLALGVGVEPGKRAASPILSDNNAP